MDYALPMEAKIIRADQLKITNAIYISHGWWGKSDLHTVWREIDKIERLNGQIVVNPIINEGESKSLIQFFYPNSLVIVRSF